MSEAVRRLTTEADTCILCGNRGDIWISGQMVPCICERVETAYVAMRNENERLRAEVAALWARAERLRIALMSLIDDVAGEGYGAWADRLRATHRDDIDGYVMESDVADDLGGAGEAG